MKIPTTKRTHHRSKEAERMIAPALGRDVGLGSKTRSIGASAFLVGESSVFARRITTEDFIQKLDEALKTIVAAPDFDVAYQEKIRLDPLLASAFRSFIDLMMSGKVQASPKKMADAEVIERRFQVIEFLELFKEKLEAMKELRASTPVDLTSLGLEIIQRNGELQETMEKPLTVAQTLKDMAELKSLDEDSRAAFLMRLAKAAIQEVNSAQNQNEAERQVAHTHLSFALTELVALGRTKAVVLEYYNEAIRLAEKLDGEGGSAMRIRAEAIFLRSRHEGDRKAAEARLRAEMERLARIAQGRQKGRPLQPKEIQAFKEMLEVSHHSEGLFGEMPDLIECVKAPAFDEAGGGHRPNADEIEAFCEMTSRYVQLIGRVYPHLDTPDVKLRHKEACEAAQNLILLQVGVDQSANLAILVRELTRDRDLADLAIQIPEKFIQEPSRRLDAVRDVVIGFLENGAIDLAYEQFHSPLAEQDDGKKQHRQSQIFARATASAMEILEREGKLDGKAPAIEWVSNAYLRGIESALSIDAQKATPSAAIAILQSLARGKVKLEPQQIEDLVGKVQSLVLQANFPLVPFIPALIELLARHPEDIGAMNKGKELIEVFVAQAQNAMGLRNVHWSGHANVFPYDATAAGLSLMEAISKIELLSGHMQRIAAMVLQDRNSIVPFARLIPALGPFAIKEELANLLTPHKRPQHLPQIALALATCEETTEMARSLVVRFAEDHLGKEAKDVTPDLLQGFIYIEAALRAAVPNLMTARAMLGLIKSVQAQKKPGDVLKLVRSHVPQELIREVLKQVDDAAIRDFLEGKPRRQKHNVGQVPGVGESIPVPVVEAGAHAPSA